MYFIVLFPTFVISRFDIPKNRQYHYVIDTYTFIPRKNIHEHNRIIGTNLLYVYCSIASQSFRYFLRCQSFDLLLSPYLFLAYPNFLFLPFSTSYCSFTHSHTHTDCCVFIFMYDTCSSINIFKQYTYYLPIGSMKMSAECRCV